MADMEPTHDPTTLLVYALGARTVFGSLPEVDASPCATCISRRFAAHGHRPRVRAAPAGTPLLAETARLLGPDTSPGRLIEWRDGAVIVHYALPVPGCGCANRRMPPSLSLADAVSDLVGLVGAVESWALDGLAPDRETVFVSATGSDIGVFDRPGGRGGGTGCGTYEQAFAAAIGETLERYAAAFIPDGLPLGAIPDLDAPHLLPEPHAFAHHPLGSHDVLRWVKGRRIVDGSDCYVPAAMVYFPYVCADDEPRRSSGSSQGLAAGADLDQAVVHGLCEVIERDAFMRAWRFGMAHHEIANPYPSRPDLRFCAIPNRFGLPVVTAFSEADKKPYCVAGIAGRGSFSEAIEASAREVIGGRVFFDRRSDEEERAIEARYRHAVDPSLAAARQRWLGAVGPTPDEPTLSWNAFVQRVPDAVAIDITTPDVAMLGVTVARVCIPGAYSFEPQADSPFLGGDRTPIPY